MFHCAEDLLHNLVALTPKLARKQFRRHIFEAWHWKCAYCDRQLDESTATIDHILPKHKGGQSVWSNLACSCNNCNRSKASQLLQTWFTPDHPNYCEERLAKLTQWTEQKTCSIKLSSTDPATPYITNEGYIGWIAS